MATRIGKAVNGLRGHKSKQISQFAGTLLDGWKIMVKEWIDAAAAIAGGSSHSNHSSTFLDEGLPTPPLDEEALFATQTPIEFSQFFDGIDEDGNPDENNMEYYEKNHENQNSTKQKSQLPKEATTPINDKNCQRIQQESVDESSKPSNTKPSNTESPYRR
ncbi:hypothetical protein SLA2020_433390 [Shorea laevis]